MDQGTLMPPKEEPIVVPDSPGDMLICPHCGLSPLGGVMRTYRSNYLKCSECPVTIPDTPLIRKSLRQGAPWTKQKEKKT